MKYTKLIILVSILFIQSAREKHIAIIIQPGPQKGIDAHINSSNRYNNINMEKETYWSPVHGQIIYMILPKMMQEF